MTQISTIHKQLEDDHTELDTLVEKVMAAIEAEDAADTLAKLDFFWARLGIHIRAEHLRLFPVVREVAKRAPDLESIPEILVVLREDHDYFMTELARAMKAMRLVFSFGNEAETFANVRGLVEGVVERLKIHNEIEEQQIYTLTGSDFLEPAEADELLASVKSELDRYPNRFREAAAMKVPDREPSGQ